MDNLMSLCRKQGKPPQEIVDNLLKNINLEEAESYNEKEIKKRSKEE